MAKFNTRDTDMTPYWQSIRTMVKESDIVLEVLDARLPKFSRNEQLEQIIKEAKKPVIYVINKSDLVSKKALELSIEELREATQKPVVFVAHKRKKTILNLLAQIKKLFNEEGKAEKERFGQYTPKKIRKHRVTKADIVVGVFGYPNVGKSSIINSLTFKKKAKVSSKAGTTHGVHWIKATDEIKLIDTPGVLPLRFNDEIRLALIASINTERIKDPEMVALKIIEFFLEKNPTALEKYLNFKLEEGATDDPQMNCIEVLEAISKAKGHLKKGGVADTTRTSIIIIKAWQTGELRL